MKGFIKQIYKNDGNYNGLIFLDRDGTINEEVNYLHNVEDITILPTVIDGIKLLNEKNIAVIVITNQPAIAKGLLTPTNLQKINNVIAAELEVHNAIINAVYSCPHHPNADQPEYRKICNCRKPGVEMFEAALKEFPTNRIYGMIGDSSRDSAAGKNMHIPTMIVNTGYKGQDQAHAVKPDYTADNFISAVTTLLHL